MFKNPFSFEGRIRRTEYGLTYLVYIFGMGIACTAIILLSMITPFFFLLFLLLFPTAIWFLYAQAAKRSHDVGYSGWYIFIPFYNLYLLFADSEFGENRYGPNPKNLGNNGPEIDQIGKETF